MKVVSNTSPIIFLSKIEALDLLPQCFDQVMIPSSVSKELGDLLPPHQKRIFSQSDSKTWIVHFINNHGTGKNVTSRLKLNANLMIR